MGKTCRSESDPLLLSTNIFNDKIDLSSSSRSARWTSWSAYPTISANSMRTWRTLRARWPPILAKSWRISATSCMRICWPTTVSSPCANGTIHPTPLYMHSLSHPPPPKLKRVPPRSIRTPSTQDI